MHLNEQLKNQCGADWLFCRGASLFLGEKGGLRSVGLEGNFGFLKGK